MDLPPRRRQTGGGVDAQLGLFNAAEVLAEEPEPPAAGEADTGTVVVAGYTRVRGKRTPLPAHLPRVEVVAVALANKTGTHCLGDGGHRHGVRSCGSGRRASGLIVKPSTKHLQE